MRVDERWLARVYMRCFWCPSWKRLYTRTMWIKNLQITLTLKRRDVSSPNKH
jgi:hypothetical protein